MLEFILKQTYKNKQIIKYLISGGTAAVVDLFFLYIFTDIFHIWYLYSACLAFVIAFFVSFYLQKFWTFRDNSTKAIYQQMTLYFMVGGANLSINAGGMYILVDFMDINHILSQIIMGAVIGISSFIIYRFIIFKKKQKLLSAHSVNNDRKIKIVIATGIFPPDIGGPATYAFNLFKEFENLGCDVKVVSYGDKGNKRRSDAAANGKIYIINRQQNILSRYCKYFWRLYRLLDWADVFYALDLISAGLPVALVSKLKNKKAYFRTGGDFLWEKAFQKGWTDLPLAEYYEKEKNFKKKILMNFCRKVLKKFNLIFFSTAWQKEIYRRHYNLSQDKIKIIPNAISFSRKDGSLNNEYGNSIIYAGRLIRLKNLGRVLNIFNNLKNENINFIIFGKGPEETVWRKKITELGLEDKVKIRESISHDKLIDVISSSKFVILPSVSEISPNLALECISMGKPILLTKHVGFEGEVMKNVITIDPLSEDDMEEKIKYLLNEENLENYKNKLSENKIKIRTWKDVAQDHLNIFKENKNEQSIINQSAF